MNSRVPRIVNVYLHDAGRAFRQAPVEVALGITAAVVLSVTMRRNADETFARFGAAAALALPTLFALSVLRARGVLSEMARWATSAAVLLAAAAYGIWVLDPDLGSEGWRFIALLGAIVMGVSLVPAVGVVETSARRSAFWEFNGRLLARIVTVVAYGAALFAALAGAVAAVSALFDLSPSEQIYGDLAGAVFFALVPWVVVGGIPELIERSGFPDDAAPRPVRLLGRYLYAPVILVYLAILLAYAFKVVVTGEAPKNLLSPIILLAGLFGFLGSLFLEPLRRDPEHTGVARLMRLLPVPMLILLPFALWAVWVRRDQYGWTEFRYLRFAILLALGVLAITGVVRLIRRREPVLLLIPVVLGVTLLLSSFGPWGAISVSRRSQQGRLIEGLQQAGLLENGRVTRPLSAPGQTPADSLQLSAEVYDQISGSLVYLLNEQGHEAVQPLFASDVQGYTSGSELLTALRLRGSCPADVGTRFVSASLPEGTPIPSLPAGTLYRMQGSRMDATTASSDTSGTRLRFTDTEVILTIRDAAGEWSARSDLLPLLSRVTSGSSEGCLVDTRGLNLELSVAEARRAIVDGNGVTRGEMVITEVIAGQPEQTANQLPLRLDRVAALVVIASP